MQIKVAPNMTLIAHRSLNDNHLEANLLSEKHKLQQILVIKRFLSSRSNNFARLESTIKNNALCCSVVLCFCSSKFMLMGLLIVLSTKDDWHSIYNQFQYNFIYCQCIFRRKVIPKHWKHVDTLYSHIIFTPCLHIIRKFKVYDMIQFR